MGPHDLLIKQYLQNSSWESNFPTMEVARTLSEKDMKEKASIEIADDGSKVIKETPLTVSIWDPKNNATIVLYKLNRIKSPAN